MDPHVLLLGGAGLLGRSLRRHVPAGVQLLAPEQAALDLEDQEELTRVLREEAVDRIVLLAAWTQVDDCESDPDRAFRVNGILPGLVAARAERLGLPLVFLSTDYVFDGAPDRPYREFDPVGPLSVYARSKWHGECAVRQATAGYRIVRTSGLYGPGGPDFVQAILRRLALGPVEVVTDEVNTPTYVEDLAPALWKVALGDWAGTWHLTSGGEVSRFELARRIATLAGYDPELVRPTTRAAFGRPAPRPARSALDCQAAREVFGEALPAWEDGLRRHLNAAGQSQDEENRDTGNRDTGNRDTGNRDAGNRDTGNRDAENRDAESRGLPPADPPR